MTKRRGAQASLMAFDPLRLDGDDLRLLPIEARREALKTARRQVKASADAWPDIARIWRVKAGSLHEQTSIGGGPSSPTVMLCRGWRRPRPFSPWARPFQCACGPKSRDGAQRRRRGR